MNPLYLAIYAVAGLGVVGLVAHVAAVSRDRKRIGRARENPDKSRGSEGRRERL